MLNEKILEELRNSKPDAICMYAYQNIENLTDEELDLIEDILLSKESFIDIAWYIDKVRCNEKLENVLIDSLYKFPLKVEKLTDEEFEHLKETIEEYENCSKKKEEKTNSKR